MSSSLVACNKVQAQANGALDFRRLWECAVHSQHNCSVEYMGLCTCATIMTVQRGYMPIFMNSEAIRITEGFKVLVQV